LGDIVEMREHRLREYLRERVGKGVLAAAAARLGLDSICSAFRYSPRSDMVYIEPSVLQRHTVNENAEALAALDSLLDALQKAPGSVRELLDTDSECVQ
jgi:hypothetical protein